LAIHRECVPVSSATTAGGPAISQFINLIAIYGNHTEGRILPGAPILSITGSTPETGAVTPKPRGPTVRGESLFLVVHDRLKSTKK
jgi:hypothetical protein